MTLITPDRRSLLKGGATMLAAAATLSAPAGGVQNGTATMTAVPITWTAPTGYTATGYTVLRCAGTSCSNFTAITSGTCSGTLTTTSCTDTDTALAAGTAYSYEVKAYDASWISSPGTVFQARTGSPTQLTFTAQPTVNQNIQATGTGTFSVSVAIEDASGTISSRDNTDTVTLATVLSGMMSSISNCDAVAWRTRSRLPPIARPSPSASGTAPMRCAPCAGSRASGSSAHAVTCSPIDTGT